MVTANKRTQSKSTARTTTRVQRARELFSVVHAIVMGLIEEHNNKAAFIVDDIQRMTVLPEPDVAFAIRDLLRANLILGTDVPALYRLPSSNSME